MSAVITEPTVEERAAKLGWAPKEEYRGKEENWVDAETYLERGQQIMPILRENNKKLEQELKKQQSETAALKAALEASQASIEELKNFNSERAREIAEQARAELKARLVAAKEEGNHAAEVDLTEQLQEQTAAIAAAKLAPKPEPKPEAKISPELQQAKAVFDAWKAENPWYETDPEKAGLADGIARKLRAEGTELTGRAFFDEVSRRTEIRLGGSRERPTEDKVGGAGRSSSSGGRRRNR